MFYTILSQIDFADMIEPKPQIWNNLRNRWKGHWIQSITVNPLVRLHCAKTFSGLITRGDSFPACRPQKEASIYATRDADKQVLCTRCRTRKSRTCLLPAEATHMRLLGRVGPRLNSCSQGRSSTGLVSFSQRNCRVTGQFWTWSIRADLCVLYLEWPLVTSISSWYHLFS